MLQFATSEVNGLADGVLCNRMKTLLILIVGAASLWAQQLSPNLEELQTRLQPGDTIFVTDAAGVEHKGQFLDFSSATLAVTNAGIRRDFQEDDVRRVRIRQKDSLLNGT